MVKVNVYEGVVEGELVENEYGGTFYSFRGIPYAQPPVGDLRFKAPQPAKSWEGVRSAKQFGSKSYQFDIITSTGIQGSEDCLYLNIYTPKTFTENAMPVMFWIHGGGFLCGSGEDDIFGPEFLVRQGVVVVTVNYRVDVLGFLCLDSEDVPGNAGLKDQVEALRWVNKNIYNFGGDATNITIFGESAGGASVGYHLVSPMSKGLFKRAIVQSGNILCPWTRSFNPRERALALARQLGCYSEDNKELYEFFKKQPLESLVCTSVPILFSEKVNNPLIHFNVVEENQFDNNEIFYSVDCNSVDDDVEIMMGYTTDEGLVFMGPGDTVKPKLELARDFPEFFVPKFLSLDLSIKQQYALGKEIRKYYFGDKVDVSEDWQKLAKFYSMNTFVHAIHRFAHTCAKNNKLYFYKFSCKSERNVFSGIMGLNDIVKSETVTCHADDLFYLFNAKALPNKIDINSKTFKLMERVISLWTNFAKYGNPTPDESLGVKWSQFTDEKQDYLDIGNEFTVGTAPDADEVKFWDDIYEKYAPKA